MTTTAPSDRPQQTKHARFGGTVQTFDWQWQSQTITVTYETLGEGAPVLLLPAFSTVSSRAELQALATGIAQQFQAIALDWPGFGESDRPRLDYRSELYVQFLQDFVAATFDGSISIIAAGHAAGCALQLVAHNPAVCRQLVLVAPTWRGPLSVMGTPAALRKGVRELVRSPLVGQALYALNTQPGFLKWMYRRHVFVDDSRLTPAYIGRRYDSTQQPGARYAPAAFVTGGLDPAGSREAFLGYFEAIACPTMVIIAEQAPPAAKAEMTAMADLPNIQSTTLPGSLGLAEEFGETVAEAVLPFLNSTSS